MKKTLLKGVGAIAFLVSAGVSPQMAHAQESWKAVTPTRVIMKGNNWTAPMEAGVAFQNDANLQGALGRFGDFAPAVNLGALITAIDTANNNADDVPGMAGLGGVLGRILLEAAKDAHTGGIFDTTRQVLIAVSGQITDYGFTEVGTTGAGNGKLEVITYVTWTKSPLGVGAAQPRTDAYRWKIRVVNEGFSIVEKGTDPNNPFPGTLQFTPLMKARMNQLGFMYKLWAKGRDIIIDEVAKKAGGSSNFVPLPRAALPNKNLYREIPENCIDMLFVDRPPAALADGMAPPMYCLGRCESPLIVNTGM